MSEYSIESKYGDSAKTDDWAEKCMSCKHVYKRVNDDDTLYCRCRKGCRY